VLLTAHGEESLSVCRCLSYPAHPEHLRVACCCRPPLILLLYSLCNCCPFLVPHAVQGSPLHAVSGYEDGSVALWDTRQPSQPLASAKLHSEAVMCLAVAPNCTSGFSGSADEHLTVFKLSIPKGQLALSQQLSLSHPGIADVAVRPDARIAATAGWDGRVRVWHARKPQPLALLRWHSQQVACVQFSANCRLLAAGGRDNHISMWSIYPPDEQ
jgi:WD40 repeat protein